MVDPNVGQELDNEAVFEREVEIPGLCLAILAESHTTTGTDEHREVIKKLFDWKDGAQV